MVGEEEVVGEEVGPVVEKGRSTETFRGVVRCLGSLSCVEVG